MKKIILILIMFLSIGAMAQYDMDVDTLHFYRGGKIYYYVSTGDTVFINTDTIISSDIATSGLYDSITELRLSIVENTGDILWKILQQGI